MQNLFQNSANNISEMVIIAWFFTGFCQNDPNFVYLRSSDFVQILPARGDYS